MNAQIITQVSRIEKNYLNIKTTRRKQTKPSSVNVHVCYDFNCNQILGAGNNKNKTKAT